MSRRLVIKLSTIAAVAGLGGVQQFLSAACGGEEEAGLPATATSTGGPTSTPFAGITGDWDTTGTPPYKHGLADDVAKISEGWKATPWYYKYSMLRYNWDFPVHKGGHIVQIGGGPPNYDPMVGQLELEFTYSKLFYHAMHEGIDPISVSTAPDLAIQTERNQDFTTWVFTIPEGVKFHNKAPVNGREMTAEDVAFAYNQHRELNVYKASLRNVERIEAVDRNHVRFVLKQPQISLPQTLMQGWFVVFAKEHFENQDHFKSEPIGTGPWVWKYGEYQNTIEYDANPDYTWVLPTWKAEKYRQVKLPFADKLSKPYAANNLLYKEMWFQGKIDSFAPGCGLDAVLVREMVQNDPDALLVANPGWACCPVAIGFQWKNPIFQDIRVRRALSMAIDREAIWREAMDTAGVMGPGVIPFDWAGYTEGPPSLEDYGPYAQYNPQEAQRLLEEAGYRDGLKLKLYHAAAQPPVLERMIDVVVFNMKAAKIEIERVAREPQVHRQDQLNSAWPDLLFNGYTFLTYGYSVDSLVAPAFLRGSPANYSGIDDPDIDAMFEQYARETDPAKATEIARQIDLHQADKALALVLGRPAGIDVSHSWLRGKTETAYNCFEGIGKTNYRHVSMDASAPDGRGGRPV